MEKKNEKNEMKEKVKTPSSRFLFVSRVRSTINQSLSCIFLKRIFEVAPARFQSL